MICFHSITDYVGIDKVALENEFPPDVVEFFGQAFRPSEIDRRMGKDRYYRQLMESKCFLLCEMA